jgi:PPOX class probable F420-dependent enzyme
MPLKIPKSHLDLITGPCFAALTTVMPDGRPQTTPVWCNGGEDYVLINTMRGFRKERNMRGNPRVSLLAFDPRNPLRQVEVRGLAAEMTEENAEEHLDELTRLYLNKPGARFFGDSVAPELRATHIPVRVKIIPTRIRVEG